MKKASADIWLLANVPCPHCGEWICLKDLAEMVGVGNKRSITCIDIVKILRIDEVTCPDCNKEFVIKEIVF